VEDSRCCHHVLRLGCPRRRRRRRPRPRHQLGSPPSPSKSLHGPLRPTQPTVKPPSRCGRPSLLSSSYTVTPTSPSFVPHCAHLISHCLFSPPSTPKTRRSPALPQTAPYRPACTLALESCWAWRGATKALRPNSYVDAGSG
jgi:hypothetical protein